MHIKTKANKEPLQKCEEHKTMINKNRTTVLERTAA